jgi:hypothetical protein
MRFVERYYAGRANETNLADRNRKPSRIGEQCLKPLEIIAAEKPA